MVAVLEVEQPEQEYAQDVPDDRLKTEVDKFCNEIDKQYAEYTAKQLVETPSEAPAELTPEQQIEAYKRKEWILFESQSKLNSLEETVSELQFKIKNFKKSIVSTQSKINKLISCDISGFLQWEQEQKLPLLEKAEEAANAWRVESVEKLDVTEKDKEKLLQHFAKCGEVADWLCKDFPEKKKGLDGEATKERLRNAINKISGNE